MLVNADFLAGSLLSLLLPVALLIALVVWYLKFVSRVPETDESELVRASDGPGPDATAGAGATAGDG